MYPDNLARALSTQLATEKAIKALTLAGFEYWLPHVQTAVLPTLTADANPLPPDPNGIPHTVGWWEIALDEAILYGLALLYTNEMLEVLAAGAGAAAAVDVVEEITDLPRETPTEPVNNSPLARKARKIVAAALGKPTDDITRLDRLLASLPTVRDLQSDYLGQVRNRMVNTPETVFRDIAKDLDKGLAAGEGIPEQRARVQKFLSPATGDWAGRAQTVARTESAGAMSHATIEAARLRNELLDEQLEQTWICTLDSKTRRSHWAADGQRVPLGGKFRVGHAELRFPGDPRGPVEEVANCRCRVAVLAADEPLPTEHDRHTERGPGDSTGVNRTGSQKDEIDRRAAEGNIRAREDPDGLGRVASIETGDVTMADEIIDDATEADDTVEDQTDETTDETVESGELFRTFTDSVIAVLGTPTDDRRILAADIDLRFREFPLPVMWTKQSSEGHLAAYTVGVLETARVEDDKVYATGYLLNTPEADEAAEQIAHGVTGPSVDLGDAEWIYTNEAGEEVTDDMWEESIESGTPMKIFETVTSAKLMGFTLVSTPAFGETFIKLDPERAAKSIDLVASLTAAAPAEIVYDIELFSNPQLDGPTPVTYDETTGRIYGHLACFGQCHVGIQDQCVVAPHSKTNYAHFHTSPPVKTTEGRLPVGRLTVGTGHAGARMGARAAAEHYDNTGTCFALVRVGEDEHGIWFSGVPHPNATEDQIRAGISAPLSGDWRTIGGNLELVAALSVNTPGFPVLVAGASDEDDRPRTLVASLGPRDLERRKATPADPTAIARAVVQELRAQERRNAQARQIITEQRRREALAIIDTIGAK
ncbi:phage head morphogenesis protein [Rhodococcus sp. Z13]|uniref:Phage head morphogenesis protein n=1 Tax=Rhodococcus sacchari TaxID=2962047 RepID=A0ACD4DCB3_9NOCA|nr:phage head morphogenesis protein [Rhodococcus sp. Z13]UYP17729.1 phage head morphogenesis protein [Rhodococcus sp. Z13]